MSDRFWRWFDSFAGPYKPLMRELSDRFGTTFEMVHTGGGCMAIEATLEGYGLMITDAADTLSPWEERQANIGYEVGMAPGYAVGVYPIETYEHDGQQHAEMNTSEAVGWASNPRANSTEKLVRLIELAIASVGQPVTFSHVPDTALGTKQ